MAYPPIGAEALREGRVSEAGRLYFITKTTQERLPQGCTPARQLAAGRLVQPGVPEILLDSLDWLQAHALLHLVAFCVMPNHLHLLFQLGNQASLSNVLQRFGSFTGRQVWRQTGHGHLWADGFYDRALRPETAIRAVVAYIEHNPVRAGLVASAPEWPWSSIHAL